MCQKQRSIASSLLCTFSHKKIIRPMLSKNCRVAIHRKKSIVEKSRHGWPDSFNTPRTKLCFSNLIFTLPKLHSKGSDWGGCLFSTRTHLFNFKMPEQAMKPHVGRGIFYAGLGFGCTKNEPRYNRFLTTVIIKGAKAHLQREGWFENEFFPYKEGGHQVLFEFL